MFALGINTLTAVQIAQALVVEQGALRAAQQQALTTGALIASGSQFANTVSGSLDTFSGPTLRGLPHADDGFSMSLPDTAGRPLVKFPRRGITTHPLTTAPKFSFTGPVTKSATRTASVLGTTGLAFSTLSFLEQLALISQVRPSNPTRVTFTSKETTTTTRSPTRIARRSPLLVSGADVHRTLAAPTQQPSPILQGLEVDSDVVTTSLSVYGLALAVAKERTPTKISATIPVAPLSIKDPMGQIGDAQHMIHPERAPDDREYSNWIGYDPSWKGEDAVGDRPVLPKPGPVNEPAAGTTGGDQPVEPPKQQYAILYDPTLVGDEIVGFYPELGWPFINIHIRKPVDQEGQPKKPSETRTPKSRGTPPSATSSVSTAGSAHVLDLRAAPPVVARFGLDPTVEYPTTQLRVAATSASNGDGGRDGGDDAQQQPRQ